MEKLNMTIGRFQPFTLGHLKCCTNVYKTRGLSLTFYCPPLNLLFSIL